MALRSAATAQLRSARFPVRRGAIADRARRRRRPLCPVRKSARASRRCEILSSLVLKHVCVRALRRGRSRRLLGDYPTPSNGGRVAPHFLWAWVRRSLAVKVRIAISKKKTAGCFHSGFATPLRSNPGADSHWSRDRAAYKKITRERR